MIYILCLTLDNWRPSWILPTLQCLKYFLATPFLLGIPDKPTADTEIMNVLLFVKNDIHLLFDLAQMTIILDFKTTKQFLMHFITALRCRAYLKSKL